MSSTAPRSSLREKILQEAIDIVQKHGVESITMRSLAEKLGASPATIYVHFQSKRELLHDLALEGFDRLTAAVEPSLRLPDPGEAMVRPPSAIDFGLANPEIYRLMFQDTSIQGFTADDIAHRARLWNLFRNAHARGIASGAFREGDPDAFNMVGWSMLHGFVLLALSGRNPSPFMEGLSQGEVRDHVIAAWRRAFCSQREAGNER
jgi:AcrR family transcriptional regulator